MKMVKSLLLGSAAGVVAIAGAQAADLPVKAKPVQYVKICSLYGVGFYYIPGTDMCIKVGGWVRAQYDYDMNGSTTTGPLRAGFTNRANSDSVWRTRGYVTIDARNQTPYGTVRAYIDVGFSSTVLNGGQPLGTHANRGFVQWAGFTFGQATSFFDFYSIGATSFLPDYPAATTGGSGWMVAAYTAQFGNGFSGSLSIEQPRSSQIIGQGAGGSAAAAGALITAPFAVGSLVPGLGVSGTGYGGFQSPDIVGNLRVEQAWGSAQIMGALHEVNALYYQSSTPFNVLNSGHPGDQWGFAVGAGIKLNAPMIGHGDYLVAEINYAQGAVGYIMWPGGQGWNHYLRGGNSAAYGIVSDAVYGGTLAAGNTTGLELTTAWNVNAAYEHHWNPQWATNIHGGYAEVSYDGRANAMLCSIYGFGNGTGVGSTAVATAGCDNDWSMWWIAARTKWNVTPDFYMGVDVMYKDLSSASTFNGILPKSQNNGTSAVFVSDHDAVSVEFRVHKDFYP